MPHAPGHVVLSHMFRWDSFVIQKGPTVSRVTTSGEYVGVEMNVSARIQESNEHNQWELENLHTTASRTKSKYWKAITTTSQMIAEDITSHYPRWHMPRSSREALVSTISA
jgi:hypothetical protein